MTLKHIKEVEQLIDTCIEAYDRAVEEKNHQMAINAIEVMKYELDKLDENQVTIKTFYEH